MASSTKTSIKGQTFSLITVGVLLIGGRAGGAVAPVRFVANVPCIPAI